MMHVSDCSPAERRSSDTRPVAISIRIRSDRARKIPQAHTELFFPLEEGGSEEPVENRFRVPCGTHTRSRCLQAREEEEKKKKMCYGGNLKGDDSDARSGYRVTRQPTQNQRRVREDRKHTVKVGKSLNSHLLGSQHRGGFIFASANRRESFLHGITLTRQT